MITNPVSNNNTGISATCGGVVTDQGSSNVTARGVCWSTSHGPTIANQHTLDGNGPGSFTSNITNLTSGCTYYVRAYATNSTATVYGNEVSFTTPTVPNLTTQATVNPDDNTVTFSGVVNDNGGSDITVRGFCWDTEANPVLSSENHVEDETAEGDSFTITIPSQLPPGTYHVRAYATNGVGTGYGNDAEFIIPED